MCCDKSANRQHYAEEERKISECAARWEFADAPDTLVLRAISYSEKGKFDLAAWPNFFIGTLPAGDTVGIVDMAFSEKFKKGATMEFGIYAGPYEGVEKELYLQPIMRVSRKRKENALYCAVHRVFYASYRSSR